MNWLDTLALNVSEESLHLVDRLRDLVDKSPSEIDANFVALGAALFTGQTALALEISSNGVLMGNPDREIVVKTVQTEIVSATLARLTERMSLSKIDITETNKNMLLASLPSAILAAFASRLLFGNTATDRMDEVIEALKNQFGYSQETILLFGEIVSTVGAIKSAL